MLALSCVVGLICGLRLVNTPQACSITQPQANWGQVRLLKPATNHTHSTDVCTSSLWKTRVEPKGAFQDLAVDDETNRRVKKTIVTSLVLKSTSRSSININSTISKPILVSKLHLTRNVSNNWTGGACMSEYG